MTGATGPIGARGPAGPVGSAVNWWETGAIIVAALVAIATLWWAYRTWRKSREPDLTPSLGVWQDGPNRFVNLTIYNAGEGVAKTVFFVIIGSGIRVADHAGDGFLRPGDKLTVETRIPMRTDERSACMVQYQSSAHRTWVAANGMWRKEVFRWYTPTHRKLKVIPWWTRRKKMGRKYSRSANLETFWRTLHGDREFKELGRTDYQLVWDRVAGGGRAPDPIMVLPGNQWTPQTDEEDPGTQHAPNAPTTTEGETAKTDPLPEAQPTPEDE